MANQKHLDLEQRLKIQESLNAHKSFKSIARELDKDNTTIAKEVKNHRVFKQSGAQGKRFNDCSRRDSCCRTGVCATSCNHKKGYRCVSCEKCRSSCPDYKQEHCVHLAMPPYVCNGCTERNGCTLEKAIYSAKIAQDEYEDLRTVSREGRNLTEQEREELDNLVSPLLKKGQSIHHIYATHGDEISVCEKTLYAYVDDGMFSARNIDMPRKVRMKKRKSASPPEKVDKAFREGREIEKYRQYTEEHPELHTVQLDSVEGIKGGSVLLTIHFAEEKLQLAYLRERNDAESVEKIFNDLYEKLGNATYCKLFPILLADNGSEFSNPTALENAPDGSPRSKVFYCDPHAPGQKGHCENNHAMIRRVIPKGKDIGKYNQKQITFMMDNINGCVRESLGDQSAYEAFARRFGEEALRQLGVRKITQDEVNLTPALLKAVATQNEDTEDRRGN
ncbi:MAG: IS30 family transposase [Spirochaetales bacterium]|nr:IS30 family transposase [Spirochaetales bacterium]